MDNLKMYRELEKELRMIDRFCMDDGTLIKNNIVQAALALDEQLIAILLGHDGLRGCFFREVAGVQVFDKVRFQRFVMNKQFLPDSYTSFKNKIGLTADDGRFIADSREVVLAWPFKDCLLEGGQTKEDAKRDEVFWNETLAPDDINRLVEPKALSAFKRFDRDGEHPVEHFADTDNLVIKGNNLLALYSLRERFAGRVKLIYIDPPYNTGNDSFGYNDNFKHSTWLTFLENRLRIAKRLLRKDGTIAISIDHNEIAYCMAVADIVFGKNNLKNIITVKRGSVTGAKVINPGVVNLSDYILIYANDSSQWKPNRVLRAKKRDDRYNLYINHFELGYERWEFIPLGDAFAIDMGIDKTKIKKMLGNKYEELLENFVISNAERIAQFATLDNNNISQSARESKAISQQNPSVIYHMERVGKKDYFIKGGKLILFAKDRLIEVDGKMTFSEPISDIWDDVLPNDLHNEGGVIFKKGKKQEKLIKRIIELTSCKGDLVLDFFAGSGTTGGVCHKMGRQYILCEQIAEQVELIKNRLENTINGDTRGVSIDTNWHGGGSFVYCELAKANQHYVEQIEAAADSDALKQIWQQMQQTGFLSYKVNAKDIDAHAADFEALQIDDQRRFLIECLDKNLLYVPAADMASSEYGVSDEDQRLTREFYKKGAEA